VSSWEANGTYDMSATVNEPNPLYPVGTSLEDRPAYFLSVSPIAEGTFGFGYRASGDGSLDVSVQQTLVLRAIESESSEGDGTVEYWRLTEPLGTERAGGVAPGESVELTFERNVSRTFERASDVTEQLGGSPGTTQILVISTVELEGQINGNDVERTASYRLPVEVSGTTYQPGEVDGDPLTGSTTETITRERTYGPLYRIGGPLASLIGLLGAVGLGYGRYDDRFAVSEAERAAFEFRSTREEFEDWITTARLPDAVLDRPRVDVDSLDGLVDTAIDVDARVFEAPDGDAFYVTDEGLLYVYEPPTAGPESMLGGESDVGSDEGDGDDDGSTANEDDS
jgi:hypothetical protein